MNRALPVLLLASILPLSASAGDPFDSLADEAVATSPSVWALKSREQALRTRGRVAGAWMDPMLSIEASNLPVTTLGLDDHPMAGLQLRAQQVFHPPGWSRLSRDLGESRADAGAQATREAELQLRAGVHDAAWRLTRSRLLRALTQTHLARADELLGAARARYETGTIGQHAVLRLELLQDRLREDLLDFERDDRELVAGIRAALGDRGDRSVPTPEAVEPVAPPTPGDWTALAASHRPALARLALEADTAQQAATLARRDALPDLTLWAGYRLRTIQSEHDAGTDLVSVGLGVPIPSGSARRAAGERGAWLEEAAASRSEREATLDRIAGATETALARWERAHARARTLEQSLIPLARSTLTTSRTEFSVGRAEFAALFEAEVALLDLERALVVAAVETHLQRAAFLAATGVAPEASP